MDIVRLIVAGGREFNDYVLLSIEIDSHYDIDNLLIVSGGARGADLLGERYAREVGVEIDRYIPKWRVKGVFDKAAGFKRNELMADNATHLIAFWDGKSKGTKHMIDIAKRKGLSVRISYYK